MFSKDQHHWIEETSAHILSHWSAIVVKDHQQLVNPGCQGWWLAVQKSTIPWSWTILEIMPPRNRLKNNKHSASKLQQVDTKKALHFSYHWLKSRGSESGYLQSYASIHKDIWNKWVYIYANST